MKKIVSIAIAVVVIVVFAYRFHQAGEEVAIESIADVQAREGIPVEVATAMTSDVEIWRTLLDFRSGYPAAPSDGPELSFFLETSVSAAEMRNGWRPVHLHNHLFSEPGTPEHAAIREILKRHPRQNMEKPE